MKGDIMIREEDLMREVEKMEKEVERMERPTRQGFLRIIKEFKIAMEQPVEFEIPEFLRRD